VGRLTLRRAGVTVPMFEDAPDPGAPRSTTKGKSRFNGLVIGHQPLLLTEKYGYTCRSLSLLNIFSSSSKCAAASIVAAPERSSE
jgi:hypothetical protein